MKRLIGLLCVFAVGILVPMAAMAGHYHRQATLVCSDCHTMHFSQQHGYMDADSTLGYGSQFPGGFTPLGGAGPHPYLLRNEVNDLCLTCHDGQTFAPDVLGANTNSYARAAGALNHIGDGVVAEQTGHTLGSTDPAPGSTPAWSSAVGLECTNCHFPHGSVSYRNLAGNPGNYSAQSRTYATVSQITGAVNDLTMAVWERDSGGLPGHYGWDAVDFNEPAATPALYAGSAYAFYCKGCHTDFHGAQGGTEVGGTGGEAWLRHPNAVANIGGMGGGHSSLATFTSRTNRVKVMSASGVWNPPAADNTPSCFSCHKSHGNNNAFGLIYMSGTGTVTEEGDDGTTVKEMCKQCHIQG